jgi:hypothetical protein
MAQSWLRLYTEILNDPPIQKLPAEVFKFWINILCIAKEHNKAGQIPPLDDVAFILRVTRDVTRDMLEILAKNHLLDDDGDGTEKEPVFCVHGWVTRQFVSDTDPTALDRKRRQRNKIPMSRVTNENMSRVTKKSPSQNVTRTDSEQSTEQSTEQNLFRAGAREPKQGLHLGDIEPSGGRVRVPTALELDATISAWNALGLTPFRKSTVNIPNAGEILEALSWYSHDETIEAVRAYATVIGDQVRFKFDYPYGTVLNFLTNKGLEKFAPEAKPLEKFKRPNGHKIPATASAGLDMREP